MTREEAKLILAAYRHGTDDENDPFFAEALVLARTDAELNAWLAESMNFDRELRSELAYVPAPADLRNSILASRKIIQPRPWWNPRLSPRQLAAAAAIVIAAAIAGVWANQRPVTFAEFSRDIADQSWGPSPHVAAQAADMRDVHEYLAANGVGTNFTVPPTLANSQVRGSTITHWRGQKIPVLCFNSEGKHVHLTIVDRGLFPDAPARSPETDQWLALRTASWSKDNHSYILSGLSTPAFVKKFRREKRWDWDI